MTPIARGNATILALMTWGKHGRMLALLFAIGAVVFGALAGDRLFRQSSDPHFVYQADAWLHGHLAITAPPPARGDDWAIVETVELRGGEVVRGRRMATKPVFATTDGRDLPIGQVARSIGTTHYVSFPPAPALLMVPVAAIWGRRGNDVIPTVLVAALILPLLFSCLERLRSIGLSERTRTDNLWITIAMAFGTALFFSAVQGRVWYTAHVVGVALALAYVLCALEARRPLAAGVFLGLAALTRVPLAFAFPLFALEAWRIHRDNRAALVRTLALFAAPVIAIAGAAMIYNLARFDSPLEFGHRYLAVRQQAQIETHGLFSFHYLVRNLRVALTLVPDFGGPTGIRISGHGLAIWVTSPFLFALARPRRGGALHRALWLTVAAIATPTLLYQNTGWFQFGYRFSLDYLPFCCLLLAIGGVPLGRLARAAVIAAVCINLFGALTFGRSYQFYRADLAAYREFDAR